jgi:hypothetical protein
MRYVEGMKTLARVVTAAAVVMAQTGPVLGQTWTYIERLIPRHSSADGGVIVGNSFGGSARWTAATGLQVFGTEPGFVETNQADAVSRDGSAIFGFSTRVPGSSRSQLYRWTGPGTFQGLGNAVNATHVTARDSNQDGNVTVGTVSASRGALYEAFVWTPQRGLSPIPGLGSFSTAEGVSADGVWVTGSYTPSQYTRAYIWSEATGITALPAIDGPTSQARGISGNGRFVVGISDDGNENRATLWTDGVARSLGVLFNYQASLATSVSDDGSIVTGYCNQMSGPVGFDDHFVWTEEWGMLGFSLFLRRHGIEVPIGMYFNSVDVSADGRTLYGLGAYSAGAFGTFVATIPAPGSLLPLMGILILARRQVARPPSGLPGSQCGSVD